MEKKYTIVKTIKVQAAHKLDLPYVSACTRLHGHQWKIKVSVSAYSLNEDGMVIDFEIIKGIVNRLDHNYINDVINSSKEKEEYDNPTAENIADYLIDELNQGLLSLSNSPWVEKIEVWETENNKVIVEICK